ncbi:DUF1642 domain-containing protein [Tetragenococcus halophilus]|uniref:DUF1642 domain-containing protein n=1 Tax=Tetragenococcus halophilus TaxID=51669 RepID=UPI000CAF5A8D|nr:DUF1642 domain-containing protein [Tetragenococcus halophilus]GBD74090.1 hypothetical protein TEHN7125_2250 [Tetragenococcus halophilus subsp. halophilus]
MDKHECLEILNQKINKAQEETDRSPEGSSYGTLMLGRKQAFSDVRGLLKTLDEPEKPEIPKFVADWIEEVKQRGCGLADALNCFVSPIMPEKVKQWIQFDFAAIGCHHDNQELLAKAWLNGYTIEKEPAWVVKVSEYTGFYLKEFTSGWDGKDTPKTYATSIKDKAYKFTDKAKAEAVAILVDGTVEEWSE